MKILVGIDDSKFSGDVLQAVITQFRPEHIEVRVLHVLQPSAPAPPQMAPGYAPELDDQKKPAHELVERIASEMRCVGFKAVLENEKRIRDPLLSRAAQLKRAWPTIRRWASAGKSIRSGLMSIKIGASVPTG
jgi:hypothetical protein